SNLAQAGAAVNCSGDSSGQCPAHLAACGGQAFCLLWLLQTGADANQQDSYGEAPIHKAAKAGSLECVSVLVARDARLELCNNDGLTAEDLAYSYGFHECARFLSTVKTNQHLKTSGLSKTIPLGHENQSRSLAGQKRATVDVGDNERKRARDW
ncbi:ANR37 protein, partial [Amia calva]|nr:ANR37 protein [Amia calva]